MSNIEDLLIAALRGAGTKPPDTASRDAKQAFSQKLSTATALAFAQELCDRGLQGTRPTSPGEAAGLSGAERRVAGGIGAKKVDVTFATEESGLILGISIKSINFVDRVTRNYQKNLMNRRGDMLFEAVTLHRRFPYAVLVGIFFFDEGAATDDTAGRKSTFRNAHDAFRLFTKRDDPAGRDEQFERFYIVLHGPGTGTPTARFYAPTDPDTEISVEKVFDEMIDLVGQRNPDLYEAVDGKLRRR